jgi:hypothetical protein
MPFLTVAKEHSQQYAVDQEHGKLGIAHADAPLTIDRTAIAA